VDGFRVGAEMLGRLDGETEGLLDVNTSVIGVEVGRLDEHGPAVQGQKRYESVKVDAEQ
jgi:hypothetical protein